MRSRASEAKKNQRGASMVEVMAVLAVIGMLAIGMLSGYQTMMSRFKTSRIVTQIQGLMKNLSTYFAPYRVYPASVSAATFPENLYKLGFLDDEYYDSEKKEARHTFSGKITFSTTGDKYSFTYHDLPGSVCANVAIMDIPVPNLYSIKINENAARTYPDPLQEQTYDEEMYLPFVTTEAAKQCEKDENDITFTFL